MLYTQKALRRFWSKTRRDENGCVVWTGSTFAKGYGQFWDGTRVWPASRWIVQVYAGRLLEKNEYALHSCDNPPCVNIAHLRIGTPKENSEDAVSRNRLFEQQKTHCPANHPYSGNNLYITPNGERRCRACARRHKKKYNSTKLA